MRNQARERVVRTDNCKMLRGLIMKLIGLLLTGQCICAVRKRFPKKDFFRGATLNTTATLMICTSCSADRHSWNLCMSWRLIKRYHDVDIDVLYVTLDKTDYSTTSMARTPLETWKYDRFGWLVGWFGFNGPLRQYFNLYRAVSQREGVRKENDRRGKNVQTIQPAPAASAVGPCPTVIKIVGRPGTGSLQHHRPTRPPPKYDRDRHSSS